MILKLFWFMSYIAVMVLSAIGTTEGWTGHRCRQVAKLCDIATCKISQSA